MFNELILIFCGPTACAWPYFHHPSGVEYTGADEILQMSLRAEGKPEWVPAREWRTGSSTFQEEQKNLACGKDCREIWAGFSFTLNSKRGKGTISWGDLSTSIQGGLEIFFLKCILFGLNRSIRCFYSPRSPHCKWHFISKNAFVGCSEIYTPIVMWKNAFWIPVT